MTIWPAWQHYEEASKGSIEVGKLADLVILSRDPTKGEVNTIDQIQVSETIKEGRSVFTLGAQAPRQAGVPSDPDGGGAAGFQRFLLGAAAYREQSSASFPVQASMRRLAMPVPTHDTACVSALLADLVAVMAVGGSATAR
jgi:hypothetical protein